MRASITGLLIVVGLALYYVTSCLFWPYARCWRCKGKAKFEAWWGGRAFRACGWCGGKGSRLRFGRRVWNYFRRVRGNASKGGRS